MTCVADPAAGDWAGRNQLCQEERAEDELGRRLRASDPKNFNCRRKSKVVSGMMPSSSKINLLLTLLI